MAVFFSGYYAEAAPLVQQLKDGGFDGTFVSADGTKDPAVRQAGGCVVQGRDPVLPVRPGHRHVRRGVHQEVRQEPGTYSAEGYDLGTILLKGIDSGAITRPALLEFVRNYNGQGVAASTSGPPPVS